MCKIACRYIRFIAAAPLLLDFVRTAVRCFKAAVVRLQSILMRLVVRQLLQQGNNLALAQLTTGTIRGPEQDSESDDEEQDLDHHPAALSPPSFVRVSQT